MPILTTPSVYEPARFKLPLASTENAAMEFAENPNEFAAARYIPFCGFVVLDGINEFAVNGFVTVDIDIAVFVILEILPNESIVTDGTYEELPYVFAEASEKDIAVFVTVEIRPYASVVITGTYFVLPYVPAEPTLAKDRKSTRLNSSH